MKGAWLLSFVSFGGFWGLICDFWAGNGKKKQIPIRLRSGQALRDDKKRQPQKSVASPFGIDDGVGTHISESRCGAPAPVIVLITDCSSERFLDRNGRVAELLCCCADEHGEQDEQEEFGDFEGGLGAGGGEGVEDGDVLEGLGDEDEDVEVEGEQGDGEHDYREDAEDDAWSDLGVGKAEAGETGEDGGDEEHCIPGAEESAADEAEENDEACSDADEADEDVQGGVGA